MNIIHPRDLKTVLFFGNPCARIKDNIVEGVRSLFCIEEYSNWEKMHAIRTGVFFPRRVHVQEVRGGKVATCWLYNVGLPGASSCPTPTYFHYLDFSKPIDYFFLQITSLWFFKISRSFIFI